MFRQKKTEVRTEARVRAAHNAKRGSEREQQENRNWRRLLFCFDSILPAPF